MRAAIPYKVVGGLRFYEREEVKDLLAYVRLIVNPNDEVSLLRVINFPQIKQFPSKDFQLCSANSKTNKSKDYWIDHNSTDIFE